MIPKSLKMTEKNLSKYHSVLFKWLNENSKSSSFFGEIHALISDYAKVSVQSSVSCCDFLFIPIVSVQWPMVGRQAWCHILIEKNVSTRSHVLFSFECLWICIFSYSVTHAAKHNLIGSQFSKIPLCFTVRKLPVFTPEIQFDDFESSLAIWRTKCLTNYQALKIWLAVSKWQKNILPHMTDLFAQKRWKHFCGECPNWVLPE